MTQDELENSNIGRSPSLAGPALLVGLAVVVWFWTSAFPALIDAATARPAACAELTASECIALAQQGGW